MGGSDLVGHNEDGPGFLPILREVDSKKEVILQKWELKHPWVLIKEQI